MTYSAKSNPNATNSELDSKRIITHKELTSLQKNELIAQYVQLCVDSMDMESFESLGIKKEDNSDSILNPVKYADFTVVLNDVNNPVINKINKNSASKKILKNSKHKIYNIDYTSDNYKDSINNVITDIRSL